LTGIGELLITAGLVVALFLCWQLWWTGIDANASARAVATQFHEKQVDSPKRAGEKHYDAPPVMEQVGYGETIGMLVVPKWYGVTNNNMPIMEGTGSDVLDQAAAGHYTNTQQLGEVGNFAIAGHRRTYGNNFRWIDRLTQGDKVVVEVDDRYLVYSMVSSEIIDATDPTQMRVVAPVIDDLSWSKTPTERWMTMTTCHPEYGNWQRYIVHLKFESWTPKDTGVPAELVDEPTN